MDAGRIAIREATREAKKDSRPIESVVSIAELKVAGTANLTPTVKRFYNEASMDMITLQNNEAAFDRLRLRPRVLVDVSNVDTSTTLFNQKISIPLGIAPAAMHRLSHPDGEKATSRAAAAAAIPMGLSSYSNTPLEDVIGVGKGNPYALQLSITLGRENNLRLIKKAEEAGYKAPFVTVDAPVMGRRLNELKARLQVPEGFSLPNLQGSELPEADGKVRQASKVTEKNSIRDSSNTWASFIPWIKANTKLEIWLKGIYCAEDALLAVRHGLDGIIVSNHGGRQLDGVPASIESLEAVASAVKGSIKIGLDGGIRRGTDIFKALALGADCCFIGRVPLWGLAYNGQEGVELAIDILREEFRIAMALTGCSSVDQISRAHLAVVGANGLLSRL